MTCAIIPVDVDVEEEESTEESDMSSSEKSSSEFALLNPYPEIEFLLDMIIKIIHIEILISKYYHSILYLPEASSLGLTEK